MSKIALKLIHHKKGEDGKCPLAVRIIANRKAKYIFLNLRIMEEQWDDKAQMVRSIHPNSRKLNTLLRAKMNEMEEFVLDKRYGNKSISKDVLKKKLTGEWRGMTFFQFAKQQMEEMKKQERLNSMRADQSRLKNIKEFVGQEDITFEDIDVSLLSRLQFHLRSHLGQSERSVFNHLLMIRSLYNKAIRAELVEEHHYPFGRGKVSLKPVESLKIGLDEAEIQQLEEINLPVGSGRWHARNIFLFSFFLAGIRIGDVLRMRWGDIHGNRLFYVMGKNKKTVSLKLPDKALEILTLYKADKKERTDLIFPYIKGVDLSDASKVDKQVNSAISTINKRLKTIAILLDIDKPLSSHIARHSFGNIAGDKIPLPMLQKLYRHSSITTTAGYQGNFMTRETDDALDKVVNFKTD